MKGGETIMSTPMERINQAEKVVQLAQEDLRKAQKEYSSAVFPTFRSLSEQIRRDCGILDKICLTCKKDCSEAFN